jgi:hypothetical protein
LSRSADGGLRRVGFELEFTGLTLEQTAGVVAAALGGEARLDSVAQAVVASRELGEFGIELDWAYLKRRAAEVALAGEGREWVTFLRQAAEWVVPMEIVCPPIALDRLEALDAMVAALRAEGARGTDDSPLAAYGVHVNAEAPDLGPMAVLRVVRAFGLLQWWLVDRHEVDLTRRISPYIDLYPEAYVAALVQDGGETRDALFDGYLSYNATRNRALDLLPLLACIDEQRVRAQVDDPRIHARPAYHYRLPDCHVERPGWTLAEAWNLWVVVERVAGDEAALGALGQAFEEQRWPLLGVGRGAWVEHVEDWLWRRGWA